MATINDLLVGIRARQADAVSRREAAVEVVRQIDLELKGLATAEKALDPEIAAIKPESSVEQARRVMLDLGEATQAQVARAINRPKNTAKHALSVLVSEGVIEETGEVAARSPKFRVRAAS